MLSLSLSLSLSLYLLLVFLLNLCSWGVCKVRRRGGLKRADLMRERRRGTRTPPPLMASSAASLPRILFWVLLSFCLLNATPSAALFNRSGFGRWSSSSSSSSSSHNSNLPGIEMPDHLGFNSVATSAAQKSSSGGGCSHLRPSAVAAAAGHDEKAGHEDARDDDDDDDDDEQEWVSADDVLDGLLAGGSAAPGTSLKLHLKHRSSAAAAEGEDPTKKPRKESVEVSAHRDLYRIHTLHRRITERKNQDTVSRLTARPPAPHHHHHSRRQHHHHQAHRHNGKTLPAGIDSSAAAAAEVKMAAVGTPPGLAGRLVATLESGATLGSGEYFMDVFIGTPPRHFSLILDTGSDLNWIQCVPCHDCFEQHGPHYDPRLSSSYRNISCSDPRCRLVSSPDPPQPCPADGGGADSDQHPCPYFYWYGDHSNTTGDLALETFTVNLTAAPGGGGERRHHHPVENVIFGCGHWNRGLFHGAAGLLGLGRGPLSFSSQLRHLYGGTFSYCLVDRDSDLSVSSRLIFGEDRELAARHRSPLNYTSFVAGKENPADTFYYVDIKGISVGGELLKIPPETFELAGDGSGGTIVDSGTTLSYFADPAYGIIRDAFLRKVKGYPLVEGVPVLSPCYNVSAAAGELPEFSIHFGDGAVWNFPAENYFIRLDPEEVICLAILGTPRSSLSILGNYLQQNFHVVYDTKRSRLGFAPMRCAEV